MRSLSWKWTPPSAGTQVMGFWPSCHAVSSHLLHIIIEVMIPDRQNLTKNLVFNKSELILTKIYIHASAKKIFPKFVWDCFVYTHSLIQLCINILHPANTQTSIFKNYVHTLPEYWCKVARDQSWTWETCFGNLNSDSPCTSTWINAQTGKLSHALIKLAR